MRWPSSVLSSARGRGGPCHTDFVQPYDFRRVSETALIPAFARGSSTDIPFAKEVLDCLQSRGSAISGGPWGGRAVGDYASFFEARFKSVNRIVEQSGATQVLELAAGLSTRGMDFAERGITYVEADLADSIAMKREIVDAVLGGMPEKLHLCAVSVIDRAGLLACCSVFENRPVAITTEGLLRYLTFDEKRQLADGVRDVLAKYGGFWVTTDIHLRRWAEQHRGLVRQAETERLGRDLNPNYFDDTEHARIFFEECGFSVEPRPLLEGIRDSMVSLPLASQALVAELEERQTFILRLNS
jgi:O-methyltransferase involved in polyketide biosynthesis